MSLDKSPSSPSGFINYIIEKDMLWEASSTYYYYRLSIFYDNNNQTKQIIITDYEYNYSNAAIPFNEIYNHAGFKFNINDQYQYSYERSDLEYDDISGEYINFDVCLNEAKRLSNIDLLSGEYIESYNNSDNNNLSGNITIRQDQRYDFYYFILSSDVLTSDFTRYPNEVISGKNILTSYDIRFNGGTIYNNDDYYLSGYYQLSSTCLSDAINYMSTLSGINQ